MSSAAKSLISESDLSDSFFDWPLLQSIADLVDAPLDRIAANLRSSILPYFKCTALVIFTEECKGRPQKKAGQEDITSHVSITELDALRSTLPEESPWLGEAELAGRERPALALRHPPSGALLVLTDPHPAGFGIEVGLQMVSYLWELTARRIREKVTDAAPSYLMESRAASAERSRVTAELTDVHSTTLETLLAALRSKTMDDSTARVTVTDLTAKALVGLRAFSDRTTELIEEPVISAFERLKGDLRPLTGFTGVDVQFIEPPLNGRALPGEVAQAARAVVRGLVLAIMEQPDVSRIRTQWDCDGESLLINVRDDGGGEISADSPSIGRLERRVKALDGTLRIEVMPGWGADVFVALPLDLPTRTVADVGGWNLASRELEVLKLLVDGKRNRAIASTMGISENTVKFHVRSVFRKLNVGSRTEAIALANKHGLR